MASLSSTSILLGTRDAARLRRFYETAFDLTAREGWLRLGSTGLLLDERGDVTDRTSEPARVLVSLDTDDIRALVEHLDGLGVRWVSALQERGDGLFAAFEDPDGNLLQLTQMNAAYHARNSAPATTA